MRVMSRRTEKAVRTGKTSPAEAPGPAPEKKAARPSWTANTAQVGIELGWWR